MEKKKSSRIVAVLTKIINIKEWSDWARMKSFTSYLTSGVRRFFVLDQQTPKESFEEAQLRLKLTPAVLLLRQKSLLRLAWIMLVFAFFILLYAAYQLIHGSVMVSLVSLVLLMVSLVLAFRYHFWYFQIKVRRLGCTFTEWYEHTLRGGR